MAITAAFDLETRQYDAVNAFINAELHTPVKCLPAEGFEHLKPNHLWLTLKALYGLKTSPLHWYEEFTGTLLRHQTPRLQTKLKTRVCTSMLVASEGLKRQYSS